MSMPSKYEIAEYWAIHGPDELFLNFDWSESDRSCWNCGGERSRLERAHIIPKAAGGLNSVENLVILCRPCHIEAPDVLFSSAMWNWIKSNKMPIGQGREFLTTWRALTKLNGSLNFIDVVKAPSDKVKNLTGFLEWYKHNRGDFHPHGGTMNEASIYAYMEEYTSTQP